ncbi:copper chaperone PCu(A)C [Pelistega suis]|uniref:Copper chaperone PCu(A)C n=1 Tax=Pelistega suis TaxID=1631957 RepID=A0A849P4C0_9BURK|nr:copper chaperone PCu(A)C [Pelistega suis]NOL51916.1 copper chaperone PCu(A)C [Pelistega suis]
MVKLSSLIVMGSMVLSGITYAQTSGHTMHHHSHDNHHAAVVKASASELELQQCWGRFRAEGPSAVYVEVHNKDKQQSAYITGVKSAVFAEAMLHETYEKDGMKGMRHVGEIEIPAGQSLSLKPGAHHVMLFKPQSIKEGDKVAVTFILSNGHEVTTECLMKSIASRSFSD